MNKKRILKILIIVLFLLGILAFVILKVCTVKEVVVEGNVLYDDSTIESTILNDEYSWNSLYVFLKYKFFATQEVPFIDEMTVTLKGPHTLHINVYEKGMMGYLYINGIGENAYFDKDGFVVETSTEVIDDVPELKGVECDQVVLYEKLPIEENTLKDILNLTQTLKRYNLVPDSIKYGVKNAPLLRYKKLKVRVGGNADLTRKIMCLSSVMDKVKGKDGTLHLENWSEESTNIVFDPD